MRSLLFFSLRSESSSIIILTYDSVISVWENGEEDEVEVENGSIGGTQ